ncbi:MAG: lasso peptide isopeptide bond-forming cyclase [Phormidesmis sp.]
MSGITGIYYLDQQQVHTDDLNQMMQVLKHRGPDGIDVYCEGSVGMGHGMLWTTPESLIEKLPLTSDGLTITADARIDNRDELIPLLGFDCSPEKITDSDVILAAYKKWGEKCPEKLVGAFAFAIWNSRDRSMFCARDHMGIRPFYYHHQKGRLFAFASETKALLSLSGVPHRLNETKVSDYLASLFVDKASTFFKDIFQLPPASCATIKAASIHIESYWSLDPTKQLQMDSDEEYAAALRDIFTEAVRCRLRSAFPIGTHLSGGLDSSSVTCVARQLLPEERPLHTFSNVFDSTTECDERPFIQAVLEQETLIPHTLVPHFVAGDVRGPLSNLDFTLRHHSGVVSAPNHFLLFGLGEAAQRSGVRVVLDGSDGDTTLSHGLDYLSELAYKGDWDSFASETRELKRVMKSSPAQIFYAYGLCHLEALSRSGRWISFFRQGRQLRRHFTISWQRLIVRHGIKALFPDSIKHAWHRMHHKSDTSTADPLQIVNQALAERTGLRERYQIEAKASAHCLKTEREGHCSSVTSGVLNHVVDIIQDYAAAFHIEARSPFMDKRLIEFCLSLPPEQKLRQGWTRYVMRQAMKTILPDKIWQRPDKAGMGSSVFYGLLHHNKHKMSCVMQHSLPLSSDYIDENAMQKLHDELVSREAKADFEDHTNLMMFYRGVMLASWLEKESFVPFHETIIFDEGNTKKQCQLTHI